MIKRWWTISLLTLVASLACIPNIAEAQDFTGSKLLNDSSAQNLYLRWENSYFFRDREYYGKIAKGYMSIGVFAKPTLEYYFTRNTRVNAGAYLLKYSGRDKFSQLIPIFSVEQRLFKHAYLVLGNIYGTNSHQLDEPIYRMGNYFTNNVEYGGQILFDFKHLTSDFWLNWTHFIQEGDPLRESFQMGASLNWEMGTEAWRLAIPLQLFTVHHGGEISSSTRPTTTLFNGATGVKIYYRFMKNKQLSIEPMIYRYKALRGPESGIYSQAFKQGWASYIKIRYKQPYFSFMAGYWQANKFIAPYGEQLFQSVSNIDSNYTEASKQLLSFKFIFNYPVSKGIHIQLRSDEYYDFTSFKMNHSYSLYFIINEAFFVKHLKSNIQ